MDLTQIKDPSFLKEMNEEQLNNLAEDIRSFLIENISKTGGHLSSNLGVVELTIALHYVFNSPKDKIFYDVGHQSYIHKILTGRAGQFDTLRKLNGLSGFQKLNESIHDVWEAGHSSTALSAAIAMAISRDLDGDNFDVIPIVGDAAMVGGESLEALNHLGSIENKVIIILNDNQMSIGQRVGGVGNFLSDVRISKTYNNLKQDYRILFSKGKIRKRIFKITKGMKDFVRRSFVSETIFNDFGIKYLGPVDGHNMHDLIRALSVAKKSKDSVVIHVVTKKGKGYEYAEKDICGKWHGIGPFDINTGQSLSVLPDGIFSWSKVIASHVEKHMEVDKDIVTITPAMISGSCLEDIFDKFPKRSFDVGIAEQHAATFAAGLSLSGKKPFLSLYSSFLQRAYDQINHDIGRMNLPCLICVDRAGLVGADGPTHHGVFDLGILNPIPNLVIFSPSNVIEAKQFINTAFKLNNQPFIIRISRDNIKEIDYNLDDTIELGTWVDIKHDNDYLTTIITYGDNVDKVISLFDLNNIKVRVINARFIKPMDYDLLDTLSIDDKPLIIYETDLKTNSLASNISYYFAQKGCNKKIYSFGIDDHYSVQGNVEEIKEVEEISLKSLLKKVKVILNEEGKN